MKAVWKGTVLAAGNDNIVVEGNHYCPPESIDPRYFRPSSTQYRDFRFSPDHSPNGKEPGGTGFPAGAKKHSAFCGFFI
jgi:hypothetical protein